MRFEIRFIDKIQAVLVAQVIPEGVVGIVASAVGVEVELLHQADVGDHRRAADDVAQVRVMFVAIDALE